MITVKTLKNLLSKIPDGAKIFAYEGEDDGISIQIDDKAWWIRMREDHAPYKKEDQYTEGFNKEDK